MTDTSVSEVNLTIPRFLVSNYGTQAELVPFVEGVLQFVVPPAVERPFANFGAFNDNAIAVNGLLIRVRLFIIFVNSFCFTSLTYFGSNNFSPFSCSFSLYQ